MLNDPFSIGFESLSLAKQGVSVFPPYNIVKLSDSSYLLELAVAGFSKEDISIQLNKGVLVIKGERKVNEGATYLHKGISSKSFTRSFTLANFVEVTSASTTNGILTIHIATKESELPKTITIT